VGGGAGESGVDAGVAVDVIVHRSGAGKVKTVSIGGEQVAAVGHERRRAR